MSSAYLVSPELFESLMQLAEDIEDRQDMLAALQDYLEGEAIEAEEVFERLGL